MIHLPILQEEENNNEVENILQNSISERLADVQKDQEFGSPPRTLENLAGQEQLVLTTEYRSVNEAVTKRKKFSSFLVKPKNPKPTPKKVEEERKIIGEPYRVKIIKQPRRDPNDVLNKKTVQFDSNVTEVEISREASIADSTDSLEMADFKGKEELEIQTSIEVTEETNVEIYEADEEVDHDKNSDIAENDSLENQIIHDDEELTIRKPRPILKPTPLDIHIDPVVCESSLPLEEQLAAVQKQLLALSQLPTAIQVTLEAVTEQLNKIVMDKMKRTEESDNYQNEAVDNEIVNGSEGSVEEDVANENLSLSENAEGDITDNEIEDNQNVEELEEDNVLEGRIHRNIEKEDLIELGGGDDPAHVGNKENTVKPDPYAGLTEEEKEARIHEEQLLAKKQKIEEERRQKMDWTQRPIVLPGGRKWTDPDDATPKQRAPKMSDDKISKTIEDFSEVIVGKTKGINFLKYQPPPKNLDYLQKSEVYRLIHGMEAPVKGVEARAEKILSEKDYYGVNGAP